MKNHSQIGTSLIEVLVTMLILSLGVLPLVAMMTFSVQIAKTGGLPRNSRQLVNELYRTYAGQSVSTRTMLIASYPTAR